MVPKIFRALKAALLRRKPTTSPSHPIAASFHAPQCSRALGDFTPLGSSDTCNLVLSPPSDAMLATAHLAEIPALFPGDDDSYYEGSVPFAYTSDGSDSVSMFSSMTSEYTSDEFEGVVRCLNVYGADIYSDVDSTFSREESFREDHIFDGLKPLAHCPIYGADFGSDTVSMISSTGAEESFGGGGFLVNDFACEPPTYLAEDTVPMIEFLPLVSAVSKHLLDVKDDLSLVNIVPLNPHEHPEPQSKTSVLQGQGQSSLLKTSQNAGGLGKEVYTEAYLELYWEEQTEEILKELEELADFFSHGI